MPRASECASCQLLSRSCCEPLYGAKENVHAKHGMIATPQPVTVVVRRRIKADSQARFESLMQELMAFVLRQPGHLDINVIRHPQDSREYTILDRFATEEDRRRFTASPEYHDWMSRLLEVSEATPEIVEMQGLALWFTLPGRPPREPPRKIKMALLTFLGACPLSMLMAELSTRFAQTWPPWIHGAFNTALLIACLTWVVMPGLTRVFEKWLFSAFEEGH